MPGFLNTPLMPQSWVDAAQQAAQPGLNTSPTMARIKGFGAGAVEGLRNLSTPVSLASTLASALPMAAPAAAAEEVPAAIQGLSRALPEAGGVVKSLRNLSIPGLKVYDPTEELSALDQAYMASRQAGRDALMGTPENIPNNPYAQALEAKRAAAR